MILPLLIAGGVLAYFHVLPTHEPLVGSLRSGSLSPWPTSNGGGDVTVAVGVGWLARFFYINWLLFWFNVVLIGFPMDGGRIFQALLWPRMGFAASMRAAIFAGFVTTLCVGIYSVALESVLMGFLALFIYTTCRHQWLVLEHGGDEAMFGYDFSQGYTSLERELLPRRRPNFWQSFLQSFRPGQTVREAASARAKKSRMDMLLEKVRAAKVYSALTDEERRFLTRTAPAIENKRFT